MKLLLAVLLVGLPALALGAGCPYLHSSSGAGSAVPADHPPMFFRGGPAAKAPKAPAGYQEAVKALDFDAVKADLMALMTDSKDWWPADYGHYGPLFIRLAWHCAGSYRMSDGRGGCDGARQRFDPERSWADNTNLDKARALLAPLKLKYGLGLSWGDLFIAAGTVAIESMGGPVLGFCAGRIDDDDGFWSQELGPTVAQDEFAPCAVNGTCKAPLGPTTVGLIYVNPEGPMGEPNPYGSAPEVRDTFGRMGMNDTETVALIGGGHAFGKTHGACPNGAGPNPHDDPSNPWPGKCGTGKGADAFTSGFEGPWTTNPTKWDNEYFKNLLNLKWNVNKGPGGHHQWAVSEGKSPKAPGPHGGAEQDLIMLTSDMSLRNDPKNAYMKIVGEFAKDIKSLEVQFAHAWYKLATRDMGPVTRCVGKYVPPAQSFQNPLPPTPKPSELADFKAVREAIVDMLETTKLGPLVARLGYQCASTFRFTDYQGGCNGARIRFSPEKDWPINAGLDKALDALKPVMAQFPKGLSWADLISLAGQTAVEQAGAVPMKFCGGRTDAADGAGSETNLPLIKGDGKDTLVNFRQAATITGLSPREYVALMGGNSILRSGKLSNQYFADLLGEEYEPTTMKGQTVYKAVGKDLYMSQLEMFIRWDPVFMGAAAEFATDSDAFLHTFSEAWLKLANADRFDGPTGNLCDANRPKSESYII